MQSTEGNNGQAEKALKEVPESARTRRGSLRAIAGLLAALVSGSTAAAPPPWEAWLDPREMPRLPAGDQVLLRSSHCPDGCRFDRTSEGDTRFLRSENGEAVIFEEAGAGAVVRIWMTQGPGVSAPLDPAIRLRVRLDGEAVPRIDLPLPALFDGSTPPFTPPLAFDRRTSSGGNVSYVPIPYRRGCTISLVGAERERLWFQFSFHRLAQPDGIATFTGREDLSAARALLGRAGSDPWPESLPRTRTGTAFLAPGATVRLDGVTGAGALRRLRLRTSERGMERLRLRLTFDGALRVDVPLADFFAARRASVAPRALLLGRDAEGFLYSYIPMPFFAGATVELLDAGAPGAQTARVDWQLGWSAEAPAADSGLFGAVSRVEGEHAPARDLPLLALQGRGKWLGLWAEIGSVRTLSREILEGDERVFLDGSRHPGIYGTGVEDLFNGGFYFDQGPFALPFHGAPAHRITAAGEDVTAAYRLFLSDAIPFRSALRARLEAGPTGNLPLRARTVAWYYSRPGPALVPADRLDLAEETSRREHAYETTASGAACVAFTSRFEGGPLVAPEEPATSCGFPALGGGERFVLHRPSSKGAVRLRRRLDALTANPAADVYVNGVWAGVFPFQEANQFRRLREVDLDLAPAAVGPQPELRFEVVPRPGAPGEAHTAITYELWAAPSSSEAGREVPLNAMEAGSPPCSTRSGSTGGAP